MRNIPTTKQLRKKYDSHGILEAIEISFKENLEKLRSSLSHNDSPLLKYNRDQQISLLDSNEKKNDEIIDDVAATLKDTLYFMTLSKKDRTAVTKNMKNYHKDLVKNQLARIELLLDDSEIGSPKYGHDPTPKHKGMNQVFHILSMIKKDLELENHHWGNIPRSGYLTGFQISMGEFFAMLKQLGMTQKDQITLVQRLFDDFEVDWNEGDRENIKLSLQQPALVNYEKTQRDIKQISTTFFSKSLSEHLVSDLIDHARIMKKRLRRF